MSSAPHLPGFEPEPIPDFVRWVAFPRDAIRDRSLTDFDRSLLLLLVDLAGPRGLGAIAGNDELAEQLDAHPSAVRRSLERIEAAGYVARLARSGTGTAQRRLKLQFRTWDGPPNPEIRPHRPPEGPHAEDAQVNKTGRAVGRAQGAPYGAPPLDSNNKERARIEFKRNSKTSETALALGREDTGAERESESGSKVNVPPTHAIMDTPPAPPATPPEEPPPTPEQIAQWKSWLEPGQPPILRRIAEKALGEAGLLTPAPAPPAQPVPPDATAPDPQAGGGEPAAPRAAPTGQDAPETTGDTPDGESVHPDPIGPQEPPQAPPQRRGAPAPLGGLVATSWAAMMARAAQSPEPRRGPKASTLVAEELLRAWSETGEERYLEDALNALCAHWRDWKRETREHWKGCLAEIRTGLVTLDEILGILSDAERRGIQSRARYFSHHLGQVLGQHREERAQNRTSGAVF